MKHLKTYEEIDRDKIPPNFKVGDIVYCVRGGDVREKLIKGDKYIVLNIYEDLWWYCDVKNVIQPDINKGYEEQNISSVMCSRFLNEVEYNAIKYNI